MAAFHFASLLFSVLLYVTCVAFQPMNRNEMNTIPSLYNNNNRSPFTYRRQAPCFHSRLDKGNEIDGEEEEGIHNTINNDTPPPEYKSKLYKDLFQTKTSNTNTTNNKAKHKKGNKNQRQKAKQNLSLQEDEFMMVNEEKEEDEEGKRIDMFLMGATTMAFDDDDDGLSIMHSSLGPGETVDFALRCLRYPEEGSNNENSIFLQQFCVPLSRSERWGNGNSNHKNEWKEIIRGSLTPAMLTGRILSSPNFSILFKWDRLDVTEGLLIPNNTKNYSQYLRYNDKKNENDEDENHMNSSTVAFVSAAMFYPVDENSRSTGPPVMVQFTLKKLGGLWLIDKADVIAAREWFL